MKNKEDKTSSNSNSQNIESINKNIRKENQGGKSAAEKAEDKKRKANLPEAFAKLDIKRMGITAAIVLLIFLVVAIILPAAGKAQYVDAYEVYINDTSIGAMSDVSGLETLVDYIYSEYEEHYNMEVSRDVKISYTGIRIEEEYLCPSSYYEEILKSNIDVNVIAWVIYVNNCPAIALERREDAQWVLEQLLSPYKDEEGAENRTDLGFLENVEIKSEAISYDKVVDKETALRIMQYGDDIEIQRHKVVSGESLYNIANSYGIKLADLRKANPWLNEAGKIYKGDVLIVTKINNIVNIKYSEYVERQEEIPYETVVIEDDSLYETQTKVRQEGVTGLRNIKANVVYINGMESSYEILMADEPSRQPVERILVKGTKSVPAVLKLASSGDMPLPVSGYRITSGFGSRDTGIEGASTFHNGIDLAVPYGTPIYASEAGKVTFAGSSGGYGLLVKISHEGGVETRYGHCSTLLVKSGQYVEKGEVIALVGSTGTSSGNHVHFEVRINGTPVDPQR
ncbi:MAG: M23 family metallopeptidase [Clostridia bacterium]|nr:M23 family metallopeptidase [Clostridia bacterium]